MFKNGETSSNSMTNDRLAIPSKREKALQKFKRFLRSFGIGLLEGAVSGLIAYLLSLIHFYAFFGILLFWLLFGWLTAYFIRNSPLEILTVVLTASFLSLLLYYFEGIPIWFSLSITGFALLLWIISFITKIFFYPKKTVKKEKEQPPVK